MASLASRTRTLARYGMTPAGYDAMLATQGGGCALCGRVAKRRALAVDHRHSDGHVRGILCGLCNRGLGYLERSRAKWERIPQYMRV